MESKITPLLTICMDSGEAELLELLLEYGIPGIRNLCAGKEPQLILDKSDWEFIQKLQKNILEFRAGEANGN